MTIPQYLSPGDTIGIVCPAGYMPAEKAQTCIETLQQWGFKVKVGRTLGSQYHYFSGTDQERLDDLQQMLDDDEVKAILCARGGYGLSRIIDQIDFSKFTATPKWIIGFSDVTILHSHIYSNYQIATLHAPMAAAFNDGEAGNEYITSLHHALTGQKTGYTCSPHRFNQPGLTEGRLVGGNLSILTHLVGTPSDINTSGCILFLEDVGEYIYNIDRMLVQLKRGGKLTNLAGLIVGGFTEMKDTTTPFGHEVLEAIQNNLSQINCPVCFEFPVSHNRENYALKIGAKYQLSIARDSVNLCECEPKPNFTNLKA